MFPSVNEMRDQACDAIRQPLTRAAELGNCTVSGKQHTPEFGRVGLQKRARRLVRDQNIDLIQATHRRHFSMVELAVIRNHHALLGVINLLLTAEGLMLAERAGIDRAQAVAIMSAPGNGASNGQLLSIFPRKVLVDDLTPDFRLGMCLKDISLALELGVSLGLALNLGAVARNQFALAKSWGREDQDCTAILPLLHQVNASQST